LTFGVFRSDFWKDVMDFFGNEAKVIFPTVVFIPSVSDAS
jgi:hypothetical protein